MGAESDTYGGWGGEFWVLVGRPKWWHLEKLGVDKKINIKN
jgi:hypothetical protein